MKLSPPTAATIEAWRRADQSRAAAAAAQAAVEASVIANAASRNPFAPGPHRNLTHQGILRRLRPDLAAHLQEEAKLGDSTF